MVILLVRCGHTMVTTRPVVSLIVILTALHLFSCYRRLPPNTNFSVVGSFFKQHSLLIYSLGHLLVCLLISSFPYALSPTLSPCTQPSLALSPLSLSRLSFSFLVLHPGTVSSEYLQNAPANFIMSILLCPFYDNSTTNYQIILLVNLHTSAKFSFK